MELATELNWLDKFPRHTIAERIKTYLSEYSHLKTRNKQLMRVLANVNIEEEINRIETLKAMEVKGVEAHIREAVYRATSIRKLDSKSRKRDFVDARNLFAYFCRRYTTYSLPKIGEILDRNHTTIFHSVRVAKALIQVDQDFGKKYQIAKEYIEQVGLSEGSHAELRDLAGTV